MTAWYVYLLECADNSLYCGSTTNLERRARQHNGLLAGGAKYTKTRRPVRLCAYCPCSDQASALRLENKIKRQPRRKKLSFLLAHRLC